MVDYLLQEVLVMFNIKVLKAFTVMNVPTTGGLAPADRRIVWELFDASWTLKASAGGLIKCPGDLA